eukprot:gene5771-9592_t
MKFSATKEEKIINLDLVDIFNFTQGIGIRAKQDIKKNQIIAHTSIINPHTTMHAFHLTRKCQDFVIPKTDNDQHIILSLQMMYEKYNCENNNKKSFFSEYLHSLEERLEFKTFGFFWKKYELEELQSSSFINMIFRQKMKIEQLYQKSKRHSVLSCFSKKCGKIVPWDRILTKENFVWSMHVIYSRCFAAKFKFREYDYFGKVTLLQPGMDYFNTNLHQNNAKHYLHIQDYQVLTTEDIKKGSQIYVRYWKKKAPNELLILKYGFCDESNPNNLHTFDVGEYFVNRFGLLSKNHQNIIESVLKKFGLFGFHSFTINLNLEMNHSFFHFFQTLRAFQCPIKQLQKVTDLKYITNKVEKRVLKEGINILQQILHSYPTTIQEDIEILNRVKGKNSNIDS